MSATPGASRDVMPRVGVMVQAGLFFGTGLVIMHLGYTTGQNSMASSSGLPRHSSEGFLANENDPPDPFVELRDDPDFFPHKLNTRVYVGKVLEATTDMETRPLTMLRESNLEQHRLTTRKLENATSDLIWHLSESFDMLQHQKLQRVFVLLEAAQKNLHSALHAVLPAAAKRMSLSHIAGVADAIPETRKQKTWTLNIVVTERPFGMHVRLGSTVVEEVFPGFPAARAGVKKGCKMTEILGEEALGGTWLPIFQKTPLPFTVQMQCGENVELANVGPLSKEDDRYVVLVTNKPYGMNIQVNVLPRVIEVMPGSPSEKAGVRPGFVITEVNGQPVDSKTWFQAYQTTKLPFNVTFNTKTPLHVGNPYFSATTDKSGRLVLTDRSLDAANATPAAGAALTTPARVPGPDDTTPVANLTGYVDFQCNVDKLPFGMQVQATPGKRPLVVGILEGYPADKMGVKRHDVLIEVAGRPVISSTWFIAMQQAAPPFGLRFKRPNTTSALQPNNTSTPVP